MRSSHHKTKGKLTKQPPELARECDVFNNADLHRSLISVQHLSKTGLKIKLQDNESNIQTKTGELVMQAKLNPYTDLYEIPVQELNDKPVPRVANAAPRVKTRLHSILNSYELQPI